MQILRRSRHIVCVSILCGRSIGDSLLQALDNVDIGLCIVQEPRFRRAWLFLIDLCTLCSALEWRTAFSFRLVGRCSDYHRLISFDIVFAGKISYWKSQVLLISTIIGHFYIREVTFAAGQMLRPPRHFVDWCALLAPGATHSPLPAAQALFRPRYVLAYELIEFLKIELDGIGVAAPILSWLLLGFACASPLLCSHGRVPLLSKSLSGVQQSLIGLSFHFLSQYLVLRVAFHFAHIIGFFGQPNANLCVDFQFVGLACVIQRITRISEGLILFASSIVSQHISLKMFIVWRAGLRWFASLNGAIDAEGQGNGGAPLGLQLVLQLFRLGALFTEYVLVD